MIKFNEHLPKYPETYKRFQQYLWLKLNKDKDKFRKFIAYPDQFKMPFLIEFLENEGVPILDAMLYYHYQVKGTPSFVVLLSYTIVYEFARIEKGKTINYIPF